MATGSHCKCPILHISSKYNIVKVSTVYPTCYKVSTPIFLKIYGQKMVVTVGKPPNNHCTSKPRKVRLFSLKSNSGQVLALISIAKAYTGRIFWLTRAPPKFCKSRQILKNMKTWLFAMKTLELCHSFSQDKLYHLARAS